MLLEFAIEPLIFKKACEKNSSEYLLMRLIFDKIRTCGMLTEIYKNEILNLLPEDKSVLKQCMMRKYLVRLEHRINPSTFVSLKSVTTEEWIKECKTKQLDYTIQTIDNNINIVVDALEKQECGLGIGVKWQNEETMEKMLSPVLVYAKDVTIIDPYCNPKFYRFSKSLELIYNLFGKKRKNNKGTIRIHAKWIPSSKVLRGQETDTHAFKEKCKKFFLNHSQHAWEMNLWEDTKSYKMHERSLITNQCGVGIGDGINIQNANNKKDSLWSLLSEETIRNRLDVFEGSPYQRPNLKCFFDGKIWK